MGGLTRSGQEAYPTGSGEFRSALRTKIKLMSLKSLILLAAAALSATAQPAQKIFPYEYSQEDLPNGLRLITVPTDYPNIVAVYIVGQTGSRNEVEPGHTGFAHLFEHLMFRGTPKISP